MTQRDVISSRWGLPAGQGFTQGAWDDAKAQALRRLGVRRFVHGWLATYGQGVQRRTRGSAASR